MKRNFFAILFFACIIYTACEQPEKKTAPAIVKKTDSVRPEIIQSDSVAVTHMPEEPSPMEKRLLDAGLVDIRLVDSSIIVDLKYSSCDNFLFLDMYGDMEKCYLQPDVAAKLKKAQELLREKYPYYSLIVYDGVRPRSVQFTMWDTIKLPVFERTKYVSNPLNGSVHNFGAAVDLSIVDQNGIELDMGTPYDYFGELAYPREEKRLIEEGKLSYKQFLNREILREAMSGAGFMSITTEWWHFNSCPRNEAMLKYKILE